MPYPKRPKVTTRKHAGALGLQGWMTSCDFCGDIGGSATAPLARKVARQHRREHADAARWDARQGR